ncbi:hypothetical protein [Silvanigrella aquatica]|uniref:Uncharacterized protein n=1 Tax=Silvanigrella aquatica TaxID=1915309 RepID=A0A1L4D3M3_9BACT|nr:hypothetical protein [Silvanigrella aquatica]APJ04814.1 hypothetical protein AXG55_13265 [Silvanigrella aquatica]
MNKKSLALVILIFGIIFVIIYEFNKHNDFPESNELSQIKSKESGINKNLIINNKETKIDNNDKKYEDNIKDMIDLYNKKNPNIINSKHRYNETEFKNYLKYNSHDRVPAVGNWSFSYGVIAVDKKNNKASQSDILWEDNNFYYYDTHSINDAGSYKNYNPDYSLVAIDPHTATVGVVNGYMIIQLNHQLQDVKHFESQYHIKFFSSYPEKNIIVVRANAKSNILQSVNDLKSNPNIKSVNLEVINYFPKAE